MHKYNMESPSAEVDDLNLEFARQLYERCVERYGEDHEQTRLSARYISDLEARDCPVPGLHSLTVSALSSLRAQQDPEGSHRSA